MNDWTGDILRLHFEKRKAQKFDVYDDSLFLFLVQYAIEIQSSTINLTNEEMLAGLKWGDVKRLRKSRAALVAAGLLTVESGDGRGNKTAYVLPTFSATETQPLAQPTASAPEKPTKEPRSELAKRYPGLHRRCSDWYVKEFYPKAFPNSADYAFAAKDGVNLTKLLEKIESFAAKSGDVTADRIVNGFVYLCQNGHSLTDEFLRKQTETISTLNASWNKLINAITQANPTSEK